jgi:hypothetical protein
MAMQFESFTVGFLICLISLQIMMMYGKNKKGDFRWMKKLS